MKGGRRSQKVGKEGEDLAFLELRSLGYLRIFKLNEARTSSGVRIRKVPGGTTPRLSRRHSAPCWWR